MQTLKQVAKAAAQFEKTTGYPAELIVAQWAAESAWGKKPSGKNNFFGMTKAKRHSGFSWVDTREELTEHEIDKLPDDEKATITSKTPMLGRGGYFEVRLQRKFADYDSPEDSIADKVNLIMAPNSRYRLAWRLYKQNRSIPTFIDGIAAAGYATGHGYATLLKSLVAQANVREAIQEARKAL